MIKLEFWRPRLYAHKLSQMEKTEAAMRGILHPDKQPHFA
jgi:hypothetical protein